jgi:large subunit ribosomal protein L1
MPHSKRYRNNTEGLDREKNYSLQDAVALLKDKANTRFDETLEISLRLGIVAKKSDQSVRGSVVLPNGIGVDKKVLVLTKGDKEKEAQEAGADLVGNDEYLEKIKGGWLEFDTIITTPDYVKEVSKLGKVLGPKGMMPNPKLGTVTFDIAQAIKQAKAGKVDFRNDAGGVLHAMLGKTSFDLDKLVGNAEALIEAVQKAKPAAAKGQFIKAAHLSTTMGPGLKLEVDSYIS